MAKLPARSSKISDILCRPPELISPVSDSWVFPTDPLPNSQTNNIKVSSCFLPSLEFRGDGAPRLAVPTVWGLQRLTPAQRKMNIGSNRAWPVVDHLKRIVALILPRFQLDQHRHTICERLSESEAFHCTLGNLGILGPLTRQTWFFNVTGTES